MTTRKCFAINGHQFFQTRVVYKGRTYVVVHDDEGIIRISYTNAVSGQRPLLRGRETWGRVVAAFNRLNAKEALCRTIT